MGKRQQQHMGRSTHDSTRLEGRDINADAEEGVASRRAAADHPSSEEARRVSRLLEQDRQNGQPHGGSNGD